jgi:hypothetical protein
MIVILSAPKIHYYSLTDSPHTVSQYLGHAAT